MNELEESLRALVDAEHPRLAVRVLADGALEIPGVHPAVGSLYVEYEPDEITIYVGPFHGHFQHAPEDGIEGADVEGALEFVREVLADRMVLWSCLGAGGAYARAGAGRRVPWPVRRYTWSGPLA